MGRNEVSALRLSGLLSLRVVGPFSIRKGISSYFWGIRGGVMQRTGGLAQEHIHVAYV